MMSGARRTTSAGSAMMRSRPSGHRRKLGKAVLAARDLDQLADPADAGDLRLVPFLEVDARPARQPRRRPRIASTSCREPIGERRGLRFAADHAAEHADHAQDLRDAAVIEEVHLDARARELGRDVGLQVREAEHEVRLEREDAVDLRAGECRHLRLLAPRPRRPHGEAGDADDARVLAEQVQRLRRLLGQADDAFGIVAVHRGTLSGGPGLRAHRPCATLPR